MILALIKRAIAKRKLAEHRRRNLERFETQDFAKRRAAMLRFTRGQA